MTKRSTVGRRTSALAAAACLLAGGLAWAGDGEHGAIGTLLLGLALILLAAKIGGDLATRLGQPPVLGELLAGVALGNLRLLGWDGLAPVTADPTLAMLAELGVVVLLFQVGLESTVRQMMSVGLAATVVAALGVVAPLLLGFAVTSWLRPEDGLYTHIFVGATLCATSVGITARVLKDLGESRSPEAGVILGAAVVDDVMGLVILAAVTALIAAAEGGTQVDAGGLAWIVAKAVLFLGGAVALGASLTPRLYSGAYQLRGSGVLLSVSLAFCFLMSWAAGAIGLAPIVGAFAAGLVLEGAHYHDFVARGERQLEDLVEPVATFLLPIFFVRMGMGVDLTVFADMSVMGVALMLTLAAILGKQACALGVLHRKDMRALAVGLGMIPRGEVGLIFASVGARLVLHGRPVVTSGLYSAIVVMVILTTVITPPALTWGLRRGRT